MKYENDEYDKNSNGPKVNNYTYNEYNYHETKIINKYDETPDENNNNIPIKINEYPDNDIKNEIKQKEDNNEILNPNENKRNKDETNK